MMKDADPLNHAILYITRHMTVTSGEPHCKSSQMGLCTKCSVVLLGLFFHINTGNRPLNFVHNHKAVKESHKKYNKKALLAITAPYSCVINYYLNWEQA